MSDLHIGFLMTTEVGWRTQYLNWRNGLLPGDGVTPEWTEINWWEEDGFIESLPLLPRGLKSRWRALCQIGSGVRKGPYDAYFVAAHTLPFLRGFVGNTPYFMMLDVTAIQLDRFGDYYNKRASRVGFIKQRMYQARRALYQGATALFPLSNWAAHSLIQDYGVDPDRIHVIPPGVDVNAWTSPAREQNARMNILFVGGDFERKGGDMLLQWAQHTQSTDWEMHIVTRDSVQAPNERVIVHNNLEANDPELLQLYRNAHVFVLPTRADCYSIATIEAMASGLPAILSRIGGTEDIVADGKTGFLIEPDDQDALDARLGFLLEQPYLRVQMGKAARARAVELFDARTNILNTVAVMRHYITGEAIAPEREQRKMA